MRGKRHNLSLICFVLAFLLGIGSLAGCRRRLPYANRMMAAARLHEQAAALIREEKARRGVALAEEDVLGIGLLGYDFTAIMTTTAGLEEKRTSQLPDFAALCVRYFSEAGLKAGDPVGANLSGSYPGLNLAVLCAAEVMDLDIVYSVSIGSSNFGANLPGYVLPEMILTAMAALLVARIPGIVTKIS